MFLHRIRVELRVCAANAVGNVDLKCLLKLCIVKQCKTLRSFHAHLVGWSKTQHTFYDTFWF